MPVAAASTSRSAYGITTITWVSASQVLSGMLTSVTTAQLTSDTVAQSHLLQLAYALGQQRAMEAQLASQQEALLAALPDWKDPKKAKAEKALVIESAKAAGFTDEDLKSVYDHRLVLLLRKAAMYDQMVSKRQGIKPVVNNGPRPAKPGAAGRVSTTTEATRAKQRLAKTGRVDDAASAIELLLK